MKQLGTRIGRLENAFPAFSVRIGCKTTVDQSRATHIFGGQTRATTRRQSEDHEMFQRRILEDAWKFNQEIFPDATVILDADVVKL